MAKFIDPLEIEYMDGRFWRVTVPFDYAVGAPDGTTVIHVPVGFVTDFASVPKLFWNLIPPTGWYGKAAVLHDYLYKYGWIGKLQISRKYADDVLNEAMCVLRAKWILEHGLSKADHPELPHGELHSLAIREMIYWGVRIGGWMVWDGYRKSIA
jgi:hypothetical protein